MNSFTFFFFFILVVVILFMFNVKPINVHSTLMLQILSVRLFQDISSLTHERLSVQLAKV